MASELTGCKAIVDVLDSRCFINEFRFAGITCIWCDIVLQSCKFVLRRAWSRRQAETGKCRQIRRRSAKCRQIRWRSAKCKSIEPMDAWIMTVWIFSFNSLISSWFRRYRVRWISSFTLKPLWDFAYVSTCRLHCSPYILWSLSLLGLAKRHVTHMQVLKLCDFYFSYQLVAWSIQASRALTRLHIAAVG